MRGTLSRSDLLRGRLRDTPPVLRPPWASPEDEFSARCDRCLHCAEACPEGIIVAGARGLPEVDFQRGQCSFCKECIQACSVGLLVDRGQAPWATAAKISFSCLSVQGVLCRLCEERCEPVAIRFRPALGGYALPEVDSEACNGCGACVGVCPVGAVEIRKKPS
ncbi:MAG: ferredoxin-type protein NapF [Rhodospirillales bacterium]|nr:ferredoxin-type protein NapF [Rhodospirillales bacterium]MDH3790838.1 ferredoxin-type protein NapF [Rhodospirillales bacterium]MDH3911116.1 ferredoxin-type protein NapF [Rhodospirillales bacterium]MDH3918656.1 ferredoxin-type protein NapF [Rhodospirillales bacterium]MDH3965644.1 ferredoxin-type protein NapF [Rhodospirillales bacterium]